MSSRETELALKRQRLQFEAAARRREMADALQPFRPVVNGIDKGRAGLQYLKSHPEIVGAAAVGVAILRPRMAWRLGRWAFSSWRSWERVKTWLHHGR